MKANSTGRVIVAALLALLMLWSVFSPIASAIGESGVRKAGEDGYISLQQYMSKTDEEDVYKVTLSIDLDNKATTFDVVFLLDAGEEMLKTAATGKTHLQHEVDAAVNAASILLDPERNPHTSEGALRTRVFFVFYNGNIFGPDGAGGVANLMTHTAGTQPTSDVAGKVVAYFADGNLNGSQITGTQLPAAQSRELKDMKKDLQAVVNDAQSATGTIQTTPPLLSNNDNGSGSPTSVFSNQNYAQPMAHQQHYSAAALAAAYEIYASYSRVEDGGTNGGMGNWDPASLNQGPDPYRPTGHEPTMRKITIMLSADRDYEVRDPMQYASSSMTAQAGYTTTAAWPLEPATIAQEGALRAEAVAISKALKLEVHNKGAFAESGGGGAVEISLENAGNGGVSWLTHQVTADSTAPYSQVRYVDPLYTADNPEILDLYFLQSNTDDESRVAARGFGANDYRDALYFPSHIRFDDEFSAENNVASRPGLPESGSVAAGTGVAPVNTSSGAPMRYPYNTSGKTSLANATYGYTGWSAFNYYRDFAAIDRGTFAGGGARMTAGTSGMQYVNLPTTINQNAPGNDEVNNASNKSSLNIVSATTGRIANYSSGNGVGEGPVTTSPLQDFYDMIASEGGMGAEIWTVGYNTHAVNPNKTAGITPSMDSSTKYLNWEGRLFNGVGSTTGVNQTLYLTDIDASNNTANSVAAGTWGTDNHYAANVALISNYRGDSSNNLTYHDASGAPPYSNPYTPGQTDTTQPTFNTWPATATSGNSYWTNGAYVGWYPATNNPTTSGPTLNPANPNLTGHPIANPNWNAGSWTAGQVYYNYVAGGIPTYGATLPIKNIPAGLTLFSPNTNYLALDPSATALTWRSSITFNSAMDDTLPVAGTAVSRLGQTPGGNTNSADGTGLARQSIQWGDAPDWNRAYSETQDDNTAETRSVKFHERWPNYDKTGTGTNGNHQSFSGVADASSNTHTGYDQTVGEFLQVLSITNIDAQQGIPATGTGTTWAPDDDDYRNGRAGWLKTWRTIAGATPDVEYNEWQVTGSSGTMTWVLNANAPANSWHGNTYTWGYNYWGGLFRTLVRGDLSTRALQNMDYSNYAEYVTVQMTSLAYTRAVNDALSNRKDVNGTDPYDPDDYVPEVRFVDSCDSSTGLAAVHNMDNLVYEYEDLIYNLYRMPGGTAEIELSDWFTVVTGKGRNIETYYASMIPNRYVDPGSSASQMSNSGLTWNLKNVFNATEYFLTFYVKMEPDLDPTMSYPLENEAYILDFQLRTLFRHKAEKGNYIRYIVTKNFPNKYVRGNGTILEDDEATAEETATTTPGLGEWFVMPYASFVQATPTQIAEVKVEESTVETMVKDAMLSNIGLFVPVKK